MYFGGRSAQNFGFLQQSSHFKIEGLLLARLAHPVVFSFQVSLSILGRDGKK